MSSGFLKPGIMSVPSHLAETELEATVPEKVLMGNPEGLVGASAYGDALDAGVVGRSRSFDDEMVVPVDRLFEADGDLVEDRRGDGIGCVGRIVGIDAHHAEHCPCAHGAGVVVAGDAVGGIVEIAVEALAGEELRAPFFALEIAEEVGVGNVGFVCRVVIAVVEDALKFADEGFCTTHQTGKALDIVGHVEGVVPGPRGIRGWVRSSRPVWG